MARGSLVYCVDTSALVDLPQRYPKKAFGDVWVALEELARRRRLVAPREVRRELYAKEDEVFRWVKKQANMILPLTTEQQRFVNEMQTRFPKWVDTASPRPIADPFVIALARNLNPSGCVVSHERPGGPGATKIPNVCRAYNIECIELAELFVREGWRFARG